MPVTINEVSIQSADGTIDSGESLTAYAQLANGGDTDANVTVTFNIDGSVRGDAATIQLTPGDVQWVQSVVGEIDAGGHDLEVSAAIDDGMSSSHASNGLSFAVAASVPQIPHVELGQFVVRAHSNVEHDAGEAWVGEPIGMWVEVSNRSDVAADVEVSFNVDGGEWVTQTVSLAPGDSRWIQQDADAQAEGVHTFQVWASMDAADQSVLVGNDTATLTVAAANDGWRPIDVQLTLHDFRGQPMSGRAIFVQFIGQDGDNAGGAETVEGTATSGGVWTGADIAVPPRGTMRVMAVSTGEAAELIEGSTRYRIPDTDDALGFTVQQAFEEATFTARSMAAVRQQLSTEVSAGLEIEVLSIGGSVATEDEVSREYESSVEWKVRYGRNTFLFEGDAN